MIILKNCCVIKNEFINDENGGKFKYNYKISNDCDYNTYIDGSENWSNKNCNNNSLILGSCRRSNKECVDFVTKEFCNNLKEQGMIWSNKTCHDNIYKINPLY